MTTENFVGQNVTIKSGTRVHREGRTAIQKKTRSVKVKKQELTKQGKTRIVWSSMGYRASTIL